MKKFRWILLGVAAMLVVGCGANVSKGIELLEEEKYEEAIKYFEKDIEKEKNLAEAYRGLGMAKYELGEYEEAVEALENASKNQTLKNATFYSLMADSYMQVGEYERALAYYSKAAMREEITPELKQENAFNEIAIYQELGEWDIVKEKAEAYKKAYPDDTRIEKTLEFLETR